MRNISFAPQTTQDIDPWGTPPQEADPWATVAPADSSWDSTGWETPVPEPHEDLWKLPAGSHDYEQPGETRERLRQKVSRKIGEYAAKLSGLSFGRQNLAEAFAAGGTVSHGIDMAHGAVDRASGITDSKAFRVAKHVPGLKKYARAAENIVDTASAISGSARQHSYDSFANGVNDLVDNRDQVIDNSMNAGKRIANEAARSGLAAVGERYGVTTNEEGERKIKKLKLIRNLGRLALNPKRLSKDIRVGLEGAGNAARASAPRELKSARADVAHYFSPDGIAA